MAAHQNNESLEGLVDKAVLVYYRKVQFNKDWQQLRNPACLNAAQRRFVRFLQLLACSAKPAELVPPVDVALVWLCYRLRETFFAADLSVMGFSHEAAAHLLMMDWRPPFYSSRVRLQDALNLSPSVDPLLQDDASRACRAASLATKKVLEKSKTK